MKPKSRKDASVLCGDVRWVDMALKIVNEAESLQAEDESLDKCPRCGRRTEALMQFNKKQVCECCLEELEAGSD